MDKRQKMQKLYQQRVDAISPKASLVKSCFRAFAVGGIICTIGQIITDILLNMGLSKENSATMTSIILIFLGALFTGIDIYDSIGKFAGAGSIVPITGFANSIVSPAIEYKKEGYVFGVGAKMFTIAGPVIVYSLIASVIVGILYYFIV